MTNKEIAIAFLKEASAGKIAEAYEKYVAPDFCHHNAYFEGDAESLLAGMEKSFKEFPHKVLEIKRSLEDGDLVAVHARVRLKPDSPDIALVHIFRFQEGKIAEEWETAQAVPTEMLNKNGVF